MFWGKYRVILYRDKSRASSIIAGDWCDYISHIGLIIRTIAPAQIMIILAIFVELNIFIQHAALTSMTHSAQIYRSLYILQ